jgi:hypothetical protein
MAWTPVPLSLPPGVVRQGTEYQSKGRWYDTSLIRFYQGTIRPVGGWIRVNSLEQLDGIPRAMLSWRPNSQNIARYLSIGTHEKLYAYDSNDIYDITPVGFTPGRPDSIEGLGYGAGPYGALEYGTARPPDGRVLNASTWSLDTWGEYLVACATSDGKLYEWDLDTGGVADPIANAPEDNIALMVTNEQMLAALGADGVARRVQWSDQRNNTVWTPAATNQAGDFDLKTDGAIVCGVRARGEHLIFTDVDVHSMRYLGVPLVYGFDCVGTNCGVLGPNAVLSLATMVVWWGDSGFFTYDGYTKPLPCDVLDFLMGGLNTQQKVKVAARHVGEFGEVWWHYPSADSIENDRYVVWNYRENHWTIGALARTAGCDKGAFAYPQAAAPDGFWYEQENGFTDNGAPRGALVYGETGPLEAANGSNVQAVHQVIHDESESANMLQLTIVGRQTPEGTSASYGPYQLNQANGYTDTRAGGRQLSLRFEEVTPGDWRLGINRLMTTLKGKR